ncbi:MAG: TldD/PmbA family protein [Theionarchaea archaeon]|nr:TldD/PmbA family protein [Theionarchaea archaeon]
MTDILERYIEKSHADLCILRWMRREQLQATLNDGIPGTSSQVILSGIGCRSLIHGSWGFASTTDINDLPDIMETSERYAQYRRGTVRVPNVPKYTIKHEKDLYPLEIIDEFFQSAREAHNTIRNIPHVISSRIGVMVVTDQKTIVSTDGVSVETYEPRILESVTVLVRSNSNMCYYTEVVGGEFVYPHRDTLLEVAEKAVTTALHRLRGKSPPSGLQNVLLGGEVVGLLAHEAVGHAAEADIVRRGSFLTGKKGQCMASPSVSVIDDACLERGFGTIKVDDEGICGKKTVIIENGIVSNFLHNRETAHEYGSEPTGNARAWLYSREPLIRMTNTFLEPRDATLEELVEDVKEGVYIQGSEGGNVNPDGSFMIIATLAQKVEKGELQNQFYMGPVIVGDALKILGNIGSVGDKNTFVMVPSICGKGGSAFVGQGGPAITTELVLGGSQ